MGQFGAREGVGDFAGTVSVNKSDLEKAEENAEKVYSKSEGIQEHDLVFGNVRRAHTLSCVRFFATPWTSPPGSSIHGIFQARI